MSCFGHTLLRRNTTTLNEPECTSKVVSTLLECALDQSECNSTSKQKLRRQVEYASIVWDPFTQANIDKIEMVQRRAARYVQNNYSRYASVNDMISKLGWRILQRRADNRLFMLYKIVNGIVATDFFNKLVHVNRATRHSHSNSFIISSETQTFIQQSFLPRTIRQWNNLPAAVAAAPSLETFKRGVAAISAH